MAGVRHLASAQRRSRGREAASSGELMSSIDSEGYEVPAGSASRARIGGAGRFSRSASTSWAEDLCPHRRIASSSSNGGGGESSSSGSGGSRSRTRALRLAFHGRREERERSDVGDGALGRVVVLGEEQHGVFCSLTESEGLSRGRSSEYCLEASELLSPGMLPGVEVARRRRVRVAEMHEAGGGGGGGYGGSHETGNSSRYSRLNVNMGHHQQQQQHHHQPQSSRNPPRPGTPRPGSGSLVRRMQDILQEHRPRSPFQPVTSSSGGGDRDRDRDRDRSSFADGSFNSHGGSHRSSRSRGQSRSSESESRYAPFSLWRRQSSEPSSNLRGAALEARNRLDERLRAAARASHSSRPVWQAVQSAYGMNLLFSDDEEDNSWSDDDGWETSFQEWLAAWAPVAFEERWGRVGSSSSSRASSGLSRNLSFKPRPSEGLSKAAISALPIQVIGSSGTHAHAGSVKSKMEQEECPVCLERFLTGQCVMALPCNHRFHPECLTPWLTSHGQCPYCRADIVKDNDSTEAKSNERLMAGNSNDVDLLSWVEAIERGMDRRSYS